MRNLPFRAGIGNDLHRLEAGRKLILGGVRVPFDRGPVGHSDGDALAHAVCDALLGQQGWGISGGTSRIALPNGRTLPAWPSCGTCARCWVSGGYTIVNIDATVGLERPKLAPYMPRIVGKLAAALGLKRGAVSVKAKTGEGVDAVGRGEASGRMRWRSSARCRTAMRRHAVRRWRRSTPTRASTSASRPCNGTSLEFAGKNTMWRSSGAAFMAPPSHREAALRGLTVALLEARDF